MERRQVLASLGTFASAVLAGCGGSGGSSVPSVEAPTGPGTRQDESDGDGDDGPVTAIPSFKATNFKVYNDSGKVLVEVFLTNPGNSSRTMVLNVSTRVDGDVTAVEKPLTLAGGADRAVNVTLPVAYDEWAGGLNFDFEVPESASDT